MPRVKYNNVTSKEGLQKNKLNKHCSHQRHWYSLSVFIDNFEQCSATSCIICNQAVLLKNRLQGIFVSNNVVTLSKRNLNDAEISLLSEVLNFVPTCNNIYKAKLKMGLEVFGRMQCLKWHFRNENKDIHRDMFKPKSKVNPRNKDGAIEILKQFRRKTWDFWKLRFQKTNSTIWLLVNWKRYMI